MPETMAKKRFGTRLARLVIGILGLMLQDYAPAFFSCMVISFQSTFMRSRSDIHRSACSWGGMSSHRFSMLARVGLEMAWAWRICCSWHAAGAARTA